MLALLAMIPSPPEMQHTTSKEKNGYKILHIFIMDLNYATF